MMLRILNLFGVLLLVWFSYASVRALVQSRQSVDEEQRGFYRKIFLSGLPSILGLALLLFAAVPVGKWAGVGLISLGVAVRMSATRGAGYWPWEKTSDP